MIICLSSSASVVEVFSSRKTVLFFYALGLIRRQIDCCRAVAPRIAGFTVFIELPSSSLEADSGSSAHSVLGFLHARPFPLPLPATTGGFENLFIVCLLLYSAPSFDRARISSSGSVSSPGEGLLTLPVLSYNSTSCKALSFSLSYLHWNKLLN